MTEKVRQALDELVKQIDSVQTSGFIHHQLFSDGVDIPCRHWSFLNQFIAFASRTADARGIKQWNTIGRKVKKGARSFGILVPIFYQKKNEDGYEEGQVENVETGDTGKQEKELTSFKLMPVFRVEDTEGAPLDYEGKLKSLDMKHLPLIEVAEKLGVSVQAGLTFNGVAGSYRPSTKVITMGTSAPSVFLHELSHAVDFALPNRKNDYAFGEVVAELSAAFLGSLYGIQINISNTKAYIESWAGKGHVAFKLMDAMNRVLEIYKFIEMNKVSQCRIPQKEDGGILVKTKYAYRKTVFDFG